MLWSWAQGKTSPTPILDLMSTRCSCWLSMGDYRGL